MSYSDDEMVMLSALQHYMFCPRQCALIHVEQLWQENYLTASGRLMHDKVDQVGAEKRSDLIQATALRLFSREYGIFGVADMVEFHRQNSECDENGIVVACKLPGHRGIWKPFPIEYKHGKADALSSDSVQLCAQAICLEEMLHVSIENGALFYGRVRHRVDVVFDHKLRDVVLETANKVRDLVKSGVTPLAKQQKFCDACSMLEYCEPFFSGTGATWIDKEIDQALS